MVAQCILIVRGQRVLLDADLARFYGESTKQLNQLVRRNRERFPEEFADLRLQYATSIAGQGRRRYAPLAFTEHGAIRPPWCSTANAPRP
ncbi:MAG: ORF6N domain-containing protein [Burkholderiaceae bacterium]|nr:ORF6N domain-containing protein [Burkholderiaceae bacterium]